MINYLLLFLLSIWYIILFYKIPLGLSVILFLIPLMIIIYLTLKKNKKIIDKRGLILIIPILLLSATYFIFDNQFFKTLNSFMIPILIILLYIMTIRPTYNVIDIVADEICIILNPLEKIGDVLSEVSKKISTKLHLKEETKKKIKAFLIVLPLVIIIIFLLSSADMIFENLLSIILSIPKKLLNHFNFFDFVLRMIITIAFFIYLSATLIYLLKSYQTEEREKKNKTKRNEVDTIKILLIILNVIYLIFDIIQIKSLLLHSVGKSISYANYARQGFFQLMVVSVINLGVILFTKKYDNQKENKKIKILSIILVFLTFIIIISSFTRMYYYEQEYGYTLLRLLVYITLFTETICLIPTLIYIWNDKFNIIKSYMIIIITIYVVINYINIDKVIAIRNIERYFKKDDIDIEYLMNGHADNVVELLSFSKKLKDKDLKHEIEIYLDDQNFKTHDFRDWNIAKERANQEIERRK